MKALAVVPLLFLILQLGQKAGMEGAVTRSDSSQPVPGARVAIRRQNASLTTAQIPTVTTDDKGKFSIQGLDEGNYTIQVGANGFVPQTLGQVSPNSPPAVITLRAGEITKGLKVSLAPAANIAGRIRDSMGQPLINVPVQLLRYSYDLNAQLRYQSVGTAQTNDRGEYRMYWVTPGRYYLVAGSPSGDSTATLLMRMMSGNGASGNDVPFVLGYAFYPGVTDIANARAIDLQLGTEQTIDLTIPSKPRTYQVRGRLIDSRNGQPPPRATITLVTQAPGLSSNQNDFMGDGPSRNYNGTTGVFEFRDILPGFYSLTAIVQDPAGPLRPATATPSAAVIPVNVPDHDVDGLVVTVVPAGSITGRLRAEGQFQTSSTMDNRFRVILSHTGPNTTEMQRLQTRLPSSQSSSAVSDDGTFRLDNLLPGDYRIEVTRGPVRMAVGGLGFLKEARFDAADVLNTPLRFSGSGNGTLDIVVSAGGGKVSGRVTDVRSQPGAGAKVLIVPDRGRYRPELFRSTTTDREGKFSMSTLAPGNYKVFSWEDIEEYGWFDPDLLARFETRGQAVRVSESSTETVDVRVIAAQETR